MKVLLIEDSAHLRNYTTIALEREGYAVDTASDGSVGLWSARNSSYDVILLDIMLPDIDGLSILQTLRSEGNHTHILLLTARDQVTDKVNGLQLGADDYLAKPFDMSELIARIQALTRRSYHQKNPCIEVGDLTIDTAGKTVTIATSRLNFTTREYAIIEYLAHRRGEVVSRSEIEDHIYDMNADIMSNAVNSTISIIRKKLEPHQLRDLIKTHRGLGYSIEP